MSNFSARIDPIGMGRYGLEVRRGGRYYERSLLLERWYAFGTESHAENKARRILRRVENKESRKSKTITLESPDY